MERARASTAAAGACLLALVALMPLVPHGQPFPAAKHIVFLALASLGALAAGWAAWRGAPQPRLGTPVDVAVGAFIATALPAGLLARNAGMALYSSGLLLALLLSYVLAVKCLTSAAAVRRLAGGVLLCGAVIAVAGLLGHRRFVAEQPGEVARSAYLATPFFAHSYLAAQYLVMVLAGGFVLLLEGGLSRAGAALVALGLLPIAGFLLVTGSRAAYLATGVALTAHLALRLRHGSGRTRLAGLLPRAAIALALLVVLLALAGVLGLLPGAFDHALSRVLLVFDPEASGNSFQRLSVWRNTLRMAADHPIFGVGPGGYDTALPSYHVSATAVPHAHNQFLHVLAELGLAGLIALAFLVRHAVHAARKGSHALREDDARRPLFHAGVAALAAALTYCLFETPLNWPETGALIMVLLALVTRAGCTARTAVTPHRTVLAGLIGLVAALALIAPTWSRHARATTAIARHFGARELARGADERGETEAARALRESALALLARADADFPWKPEVPALQADLLFTLGRHEEALEATRLADARMPGSYSILSAQGLVLMKLGRPEEAIVPLRRAIAAYTGPEAVEAYVTLGRALALLDRDEEAWSVFMSLIDPGVAYDTLQPVVLLDAVRALLALDRNLAEARSLLQRYRRRVPPGTDLTAADQLEAELGQRLARPRREIAR